MCVCAEGPLVVTVSRLGLWDPRSGVPAQTYRPLSSLGASVSRFPPHPTPQW